MTHNDMCFTCNHSTVNTSCKCGLNHNSDRLFEIIKEKDNLIKELKEVLLDAGSKSHKGKILHKRYCENI